MSYVFESQPKHLYFLNHLIMHLIIQATNNNNLIMETVAWWLLIFPRMTRMFAIFIPYQNMFQHIMFHFSIIDTHKQTWQLLLPLFFVKIGEKKRRILYLSCCTCQHFHIAFPSFANLTLLFEKQMVGSEKENNT